MHTIIKWYVILQMTSKIVVLWSSLNCSFTWYLSFKYSFQTCDVSEMYFSSSVNIAGDFFSGYYSSIIERDKFCLHFTENDVMQQKEKYWKLAAEIFLNLRIYTYITLWIFCQFWTPFDIIRYQSSILFPPPDDNVINV